MTLKVSPRSGTSGTPVLRVRWHAVHPHPPSSSKCVHSHDHNSPVVNFWNQVLVWLLVLGLYSMIGSYREFIRKKTPHCHSPSSQHSMQAPPRLQRAWTSRGTVGRDGSNDITVVVETSEGTTVDVEDSDDAILSILDADGIAVSTEDADGSEVDIKDSDVLTVDTKHSCGTTFGTGDCCCITAGGEGFGGKTAGIAVDAKTVGDVTSDVTMGGEEILLASTLRFS